MTGKPLEAPAMRLPRVRFTVRRLMVAVGVIGLMLEVGVLWRRSEEYRRLAAYYAVQEDLIKPKVYDHGSELLDLQIEATVWRRKAETYRPEQAQAQRVLDAKVAAGLPTSQQERREPWYWKMQADEADRNAHKAESRVAYLEAGPAYYGRMRARYERAASRPWESLELEPVPWERSGATESFQLDPPPP